MRPLPEAALGNSSDQGRPGPAATYEDTES